MSVSYLERWCSQVVSFSCPMRSHIYYNRKAEGNNMHKGTVKKWYNDRGFGFIAGSDGQDVFVHHTDLGGMELIVGGEVCCVLIII